MSNNYRPGNANNYKGTSLHQVLMDQREMQLSPLITAAAAANLRAAVSVAEMQESITKKTVRDNKLVGDFDTVENLTNKYVSLSEAKSKLAADDPYITILDSQLQTIIDKVSNM